MLKHVINKMINVTYECRKSYLLTLELQVFVKTRTHIGTMIMKLPKGVNVKIPIMIVEQKYYF